MEAMKKKAVKRLTKDEEKALGAIIQENKDKQDSESQRKFREAAETLFKQYEGLAISQAQKIYRNANAIHYDINDLIQDALVGLWKGILIYDGYKNNTRCSTIAFFYIRKEIHNAISNSREIKLKSKEETLWDNFIKTKELLEGQGLLEDLSYNAAFQLVCDEADIDESEMMNLLNTVNSTTSLNDPASHDNGMELGELIAEDSKEDPEEELIREILEDLPKKEQEILLANYLRREEREVAIETIIEKYGMEGRKEFHKIHRKLLNSLKKKYN